MFFTEGRTTYSLSCNYNVVKYCTFYKKISASIEDQ